MVDLLDLISYCESPARNDSKPGEWLNKALTFLLEPAAVTLDSPTKPIEVTKTVLLLPSQFKQLQDSIDDNDHLVGLFRPTRWTYLPNSCRLLVVMSPSIEHELTSTEYGKLIEKRLAVIAGNGSCTGDFAEAIRDCGSVGVKLKELLRTELDCQFSHDDEKFPGVIPEVSCSQKWVDVDRKVRPNLFRGWPRVAVAVAIDYPDWPYGLTATLSVWRPYIYRKEGESADYLGVKLETDREEFLSADGAVVNGAESLRLFLSDFATVLFRKLGDTVTNPAIAIFYHELAHVANVAIRKAAGL